MLDASRINWKVVGAILVAVGYIAYRNKGFAKLPKALASHGAVAAVLGIVAYFGLQFVLQQVQKVNGVPYGYAPELPPFDQAPVYAPQPQQPQQPPRIAAVDPNGNYYAPSLGC